MKHKFGLTMERRHQLEGILFVMPFIVGLLMFFFYPVYMSLRLSLGNLVTIYKFQIEWAGLEHYERAFVWDVNFIPMLFEIIRNMLLKVPMVVISSLLIAIVVNKNIKFKGFFRVVFFLPFILGTGLVMQQLVIQGVNVRAIESAKNILFSQETLNYLGPKISDAITTFFSMIPVALWSSGVQFLLFLSGLQGIPASLYESAHVDGSNEWDNFWKITLPMISPVTVIVIIYTIVDSFTEGTNPLIDYIRYLVSTGVSFEYAAAIGWIYFLFIILLLLFAFVLMRKAADSPDQKGAMKRNERRSY